MVLLDKNKTWRLLSLSLARRENRNTCFKNSNDPLGPAYVPVLFELKNNAHTSYGVFRVLSEPV